MSLTSDGYYLYFFSGQCNSVWRVSLATGAVSHVADIGWVSGMAVGAGGAVYATTSWSSSTSGSFSGVVRLDPATDTLVPFVSLGSLAGAAITADAQDLWVQVANNAYPYAAVGVDRIASSDGSVTQLISDSTAGATALVSAGDYLYGFRR